MSDEPTGRPDPEVDDLPEQLRIRREKRQHLLDDGIEPYARGFPRTHTLAEVRAAYPGLAVDTATGDQVAVTGRVLLRAQRGQALLRHAA